MIANVLHPVVDWFVFSLEVHGDLLSSVKDILPLAVKQVPVSRENRPLECFSMLGQGIGASVKVEVSVSHAFSEVFDVLKSEP